jgi:hypothetical protein
MRALVFTSDKTQWALQAFAHQWNKYVGDAWPVLVCGFTPPAFPLPRYFKFHSIGPFDEFPVNRWSDAVIRLLSELEDEIILFTMDDFWLARKVDTEAIDTLALYMRRDNPRVARLDLTTDRLYAGNLTEAGALGRLDLISNTYPVAYAMSFQNALWRRTELLKHLRPNESPWDSEINGTRRMEESNALILGTRQAPMRYLIAVQQGKLAFDGGYQVPRVPFTDWEELKTLGYLEEAMAYA